MRWQLSSKPKDLERFERAASAAMKSGNFNHSSIALYEEALEQAPTLPTHCEFYWRAYRMIESMRPNSMAAGKLRWDDTMAVAKHYKLREHEQEELWFIIKSLDEVIHEAQDGSSSPKKEPAKSTRGGFGGLNNRPPAK